MVEYFYAMFELFIRHCWLITYWYVHMFVQVYGPPGDYENKQEYFPRIADAIFRSTKMNKNEKQQSTEHEIWRVSRALQRVAAALRGNPIWLSDDPVYSRDIVNAEKPYDEWVLLIKRNIAADIVNVNVFLPTT